MQLKLESTGQDVSLSSDSCLFLQTHRVTWKHKKRSEQRARDRSKMKRRTGSHLIIIYQVNSGLLWWLSGKESACKAGDPGSIPQRREWQPTPVFLPVQSHGQRNLVGYIVHRVTKSWA